MLLNTLQNKYIHIHTYTHVYTQSHTYTYTLLISHTIFSHIYAVSPYHKDLKTWKSIKGRLLKVFKVYKLCVHEIQLSTKHPNSSYTHTKSVTRLHVWLTLSYTRMSHQSTQLSIHKKKVSSNLPQIRVLTAKLTPSSSENTSPSTICMHHLWRTHYATYRAFLIYSFPQFFLFCISIATAFSLPFALFSLLL
jgi:hypothetical protein